MGALLPLCFALLWFTSLHPYLLAVGLGVGFAATESNGLAMLAEVTPTGLLGSAYGLLGCGLSFFLLFQPWLVGYLHAHSDQPHAHILLLFLLLSGLGWLVSLCIYVWDIRHSSLLSLSSAQKQLQQLGVGADCLDGHDPAAPPPYPELEIVFEVEEEDDEEDEEEGMDGQGWAGRLQLEEEEEGEEQRQLQMHDLHFQQLQLEAGGRT
jgi:MFS family permease